MAKLTAKACWYPPTLKDCDMAQIEIKGETYHRFLLFQDNRLLAAVQKRNGVPAQKEIHEFLEEKGNEALRETVLDWLDHIAYQPRERGFIRTGDGDPWTDISTEWKVGLQ